MTRLEVVELPADRLPGDALLVPLFEDQRPLEGPVGVVDWRLDGALTRMLLDGELTGRSGEKLALQTNARFAAPWVMVGGSGRWRSLDRSGYLTLIERLLRMAASASVREIALCLPPGNQFDPVELERMVSEALIGMDGLKLCRLSCVSGLN